MKEVKGGIPLEITFGLGFQGGDNFTRLKKGKMSVVH